MVVLLVGGDLEPRLSPWSMEGLEAVDVVSLAFTVFKAFGFESIRWQRSWGNDPGATRCRSGWSFFVWLVLVSF